MKYVLIFTAMLAGWFVLVWYSGVDLLERSPLNAYLLVWGLFLSGLFTYALKGTDS
jgi:hypothetical protein